MGIIDRESYEECVYPLEKELAALKAEIRNLRSALKVIYTWAAFDDAEKARIALTPGHVMELADKALRGK